MKNIIKLKDADIISCGCGCTFEATDNEFKTTKMKPYSWNRGKENAERYEALCQCPSCNSYLNRDGSKYNTSDFLDTNRFND